MIRQILKLRRCTLLVAGLLLLSAPGWAQPGDPQRGEDLYVGSISFSEGGAPCLACHGIAGHKLGFAAGANYGPDLTAMYEDYGEEGVVDVLEDLSFESMAAIYASRPLTEMEVADLVAFFATVPTGPAPGITSGLALHVALVTVFFMILIGVLGWRRLQSVRQPLVARTLNRKGETT